MIDGDAIQPGPQTSLATKLFEMAIGFKENIVRDVLGEGGIANCTQGQIINVTLLVEGLPGPGRGYH
jgi:hypothetical protein